MLPLVAPEYLQKAWIGESSSLRGWPDDTLGGGLWVFWKKKDCSARSDKKIVFSANCQNKKFVHKTGRKMGPYEGGKSVHVPLPERKQKFVSGYEWQKKVCSGEKIIAPPPHVPSGPPLTAQDNLSQPLLQMGPTTFQDFHPSRQTNLLMPNHFPFLLSRTPVSTTGSHRWLPQLQLAWQSKTLGRSSKNRRLEMSLMNHLMSLINNDCLIPSTESPAEWWCCLLAVSIIQS